MPIMADDRIHAHARLSCPSPAQLRGNPCNLSVDAVLHPISCCIDQTRYISRHRGHHTAHHVERAMAALSDKSVANARRGEHSDDLVRGLILMVRPSTAKDQPGAQAHVGSAF